MYDEFCPAFFFVPFESLQYRELQFVVFLLLALLVHRVQAILDGHTFQVTGSYRQAIWKMEIDALNGRSNQVCLEPVFLVDS